MLMAGIFGRGAADYKDEDGAVTIRIDWPMLLPLRVISAIVPVCPIDLLWE